MSAHSAFRFALASMLLFAASAQAQIFRAYVASDGNDANPCTLVQPCRLLPAALAAVASGGDIWMLDSANYNTGTVTIGKSVSILAVPGAVGSLVAVNGGPAIQISADGLAISLRNLVIGPVAGGVAGTHGVHMFGDSSLTIDNSVIANMPQRGVQVTSASGATLALTNTTIRNCLLAVFLSGGASATISSSFLIDNSGGGVSAVGTILGTTTTASLDDTVVSGGTEGVVAQSSVAGANARIAVARSTIRRTVHALRSLVTAAATAEVSVGGSLIVDNTNAWNQSGAGATILSLGNNQMSGNTGVVGTKTPLAGQ